MKNFFIIVNAEKPMAEKTRRTIEAYLKNAPSGVSYAVWDKEKQERYELPEGCDCIITIGGDGTLIQAARDLAGLNIPILGINLGTLGYLTQGNGQDVPEILEARNRQLAGPTAPPGGLCLMKVDY